MSTSAVGRHQLELLLGRVHRLAARADALAAGRARSSAGRRRGRRPGSSTAPPRRRCGSTPAPSPAAAGRAARRAAAGTRAGRRRQIAMTTSLSVPPVASLSRLRLLSDAERMAKRRWAVMDLFHGVGGAAVTRERDAGPVVRAGRGQRLDRRAGLAGRGADARDPGRVGEVADDAHLHPHRLGRVAQQVGDRQAQQLDVAGDRLRLPRRALAGRLGVGRVVVEQVQHDHAGRAVDRGVVVLREQRPASALQALDDVDLPQRADAVHRPADDAGDLLGRAGRRGPAGPGSGGGCGSRGRSSGRRSSTGGRGRSGTSTTRRRIGSSSPTFEAKRA